MASVNQDINKTADPSYLGLSQGTDRAKIFADTSKEDLLKGIAQLGHGVVKATHGLMTQSIQDDIQKKVDAIQSDAGVYQAADLAASGVSPTDVQGEANIFGDTSNIKTGKGNPAGVARLGQSISGLQEAYDQGKLSESYYNARLLAVVKEAKSQYPGFKDEIDQIIQRTTGINPANALVRSLRSDMDAMERAKASAANKDESWLNQHAQFVSEASRQRWAAGDRSPAFVAQFKLEASNFMSRNAQVESAMQGLNLMKQKGEWDDREGVRTAQIAVTGYVDKKFFDMHSTLGGSEGLGKIMKAAGDKPLTPDQQAAVAAEAGKFRLETLSGVDAILSRPELAQLPQSQKDAIRAAVVTRLAEQEKALIDKNFGVLTADARYIEATQDSDVRRLYETNDTYRKIHAASKAAGAGASVILSDMFSQNEGAQKLHAASKSLLDLDLAELSIGEGNLNDQVKRQKAAAKGGITKFDDPEIHRIRVNAAVKGLTTTKDAAEAENYAKGMFGPGMTGFLSNYSSNSQQRVFRALTSPAVDLKMVEIGKTNPELYKSYRDWVVNYGFQSQVKRSLDEINQIHTDPSTFAQITFDGSHFRVDPRPGTENARRGRGGPDPLENARAAVTELNQNIDIISPILKREGGDPVMEIGEALKANGWDPNAPKRPGMLQSLGNAISGAFGSLTGESKPAPEGLDSQSLEYRLDSPPKGPVRTDKGSTSQNDLIDLDTGTIKDIGARAEGLKKVIRTAESSDNYDNVFGTSRKIPLTSMTLNEVDALQSQMKKAGSKSTAVGGYQFLQGTLRELKDKLGLKGDETFTKKLQDQLADALLQRRGYGEYLKGNMTRKELVNKLAQEWAGLPTTAGQSFYEGDGLNHSTVKLRPILDELKTVRTAAD